MPSRVIAIAKTNVNAVMEEGNALAFKKGDNIVVQGRSGPDIFIGTAHGRKGSFLVQDATFYRGKRGDMYMYLYMFTLHACTCTCLHVLCMYMHVYIWGRKKGIHVHCMCIRIDI